MNRNVCSTILGNRMRFFAQVALILLLGSLPFLSAGCGSSGSADSSAVSESAEKEELPHVQATKVVVEDIDRSIEVPGLVEGYESADLYAKVGGYLESMRVDIGDPIKKGQPLAKLRVPEMEKQLLQKQALVKQANAELDQAKAAIDQAKADVHSAEALVEQTKAELGDKLAQMRKNQKDFDRIKELYEKDAITKEKLDAAQFALESAQAGKKSVEAKVITAKAKVKAAEAREAKAKADWDSAEARVGVAEAEEDYLEAMMDYATIRAPFDGVVTKRWIHPGAFVQPAEGNSAAKPLLTVSRTDKLRIFVHLPMSVIRWLDADDQAEVRVESLPGEVFAAKVNRFSKALNEVKMMRVELGLEKHDPRIYPGSYVYAKVHLIQHSQAPVIPASALLTDKKGKYVYRIIEDTIERQPVTTLYEDGKKVGIATGLSGDETVVRTGGGQVTAGQKVAAVVSQ